MKFKTFFFGTWISGWGRAVSWGHYAMVTMCVGLTCAGLFLPGVEWAMPWVLIFWPLVSLSFINQKRPWFLRSSAGEILDLVER